MQIVRADWVNSSVSTVRPVWGIPTIVSTGNRDYRPTINSKGVSCIVAMYNVLCASWVHGNSSAQLPCTMLPYIVKMLYKVEHACSETELPLGSWNIASFSNYVPWSEWNVFSGPNIPRRYFQWVFGSRSTRDFWDRNKNRVSCQVTYYEVYMFTHFIPDGNKKGVSNFKINWGRLNGSLPGGGL